MPIENEMLHGTLPRSGGLRQQARLRPAPIARIRQERTVLLPLSEHWGWGEWDAGPRLWTEIQARRGEGGETDRRPVSAVPRPDPG